MKKNIEKRTYFAILTAFSLLIGLLGAWILTSQFADSYFVAYPFIPVYFFVFGFLMIYLFEHIRKNIRAKSLLLYVWLRMMKLMVSIVVLILYGVFVGVKVKEFMLTFIIFYIVFLVFEVLFFYHFERNEEFKFRRRNKRKKTELK